MSEPAIVIPAKRVSWLSGLGWPDARGWVIAGFFALEFFMLYLVKEDGTLLANSSFMQTVTAITTGGVLLIAQNLFGGTRSGAEMNAKVGDALTASVAQQTTPTVIVAPPTAPKP